jgi:hypothetical protein
LTTWLATWLVYYLICLVCSWILWRANHSCTYHSCTDNITSWRRCIWTWWCSVSCRPCICSCSCTGDSISIIIIIRSSISCNLRLITSSICSRISSNNRRSSRILILTIYITCSIIRNRLRAWRILTGNISDWLLRISIIRIWVFLVIWSDGRRISNCFSSTCSNMIEILLICNRFLTFLTIFSSGFTLFYMLLVFISRHQYFTVATLNRFRYTIFIMLFNFQGRNLCLTIFTRLKTMKLFLMLIMVVNIIRSFTLCTSFDISTTIS